MLSADADDAFSMREGQRIASQIVTCARIDRHQTGTRWVSDHRFRFASAHGRSARLKDELESILCDTEEVRDKDARMLIDAPSPSLAS